MKKNTEKKLNGTVIVTYRCNARCSMCNRYKAPSKPEEEISLDTIKKLPKMYFTNITGGEPFIRTDLKDIVRELYKKSDRIVISTNGFFTDRIVDLCKEFPNIGMEGSLKMKEISYIHSEAYAAGELKHGTISLIEDDILVVGVLTQPELYEKTISNMLECKSRGAYLMGLTTFGKYNIEDTADFTVYIPKTDPLFATSLAVIPLQLLGYYISVAKGLDVDKPRNLAKSVTVE